ncbi:MAG: cupin domain-containing protein, partial [Alphaproteobacteria bacterium]
LEAHSDVRWRLLSSDECMQTAELAIGIAEITPGATLIDHCHTHAETNYIMSGREWMCINAEENKIGPGTAIYIPPDAEHSCKGEGDTPLEFVFTFPYCRFDEVV